MKNKCFAISLLALVLQINGFPASSLEIDPVSISNGGYKITTNAPSVATGKLFLFIGSEANALDITGGYKPVHLEPLLAIVASSNQWGKTIQCWVAIKQGDSVVPASKSPQKAMKAPVRPYEGPLTLSALKADPDGQKIPYINPGRLLTKPIGGKRFFKYGGLFETESDKRGFDCTTYIGSLYELSSGMASTSQLAQSIQASTSILVEVSISAIRAYFDIPANVPGRYLLWHDSHVVLVENGVVKEFAQSAGGFASTPVAQWHLNGTKKYSLNKF
jgi:hypothetical protein